MLRSLVLPIESVAVASLAWLFDLPLWKDDGRPWQVTPNQIRADPVRYVEHYQRAMHRELSYPIHLVKFNGRWTVLDGYHRLLQADLVGRKVVPSMRLSEVDFQRILAPSDAP